MQFFPATPSNADLHGDIAVIVFANPEVFLVPLTPFWLFLELS